MFAPPPSILNSALRRDARALWTGEGVLLGVCKTSPLGRIRSSPAPPRERLESNPENSANRQQAWIDSTHAATLRATLAL